MYNCCDSSFALPSVSAKHCRPSLEGSPPPGVLAKGKAGGKPGGLELFWGGIIGLCKMNYIFLYIGSTVDTANAVFKAM